MSTIEIAAQDVAGVQASRAGGAARVELCSALDFGGLTPSLATTEAAARCGLPIVVLIRPRPGDFSYSTAEIEVTTRDIELALQAGASGVVIGALRDGGLDHAALRTWCEVAQQTRPGAQVTIHRCVDVLLSQGLAPVELMTQLTELGGITRVLTSGGGIDCAAGRTTLGELASCAGEIEIQAGGGLKTSDIAPLENLGIQAFHLSARRQIPSGPAGPGGGVSSYDVTDPELVARFVRCTSPESESR